MAFNPFSASGSRQIGIVGGSILLVFVIGAGVYIQFFYLGAQPTLPAQTTSYPTQTVLAELKTGGVFYRLTQLAPVTAQNAPIQSVDESELGKTDLGQYNH